MELCYHMPRLPPSLVVKASTLQASDMGLEFTGLGWETRCALGSCSHSLRFVDNYKGQLQPFF